MKPMPLKLNLPIKAISLKSRIFLLAAGFTVMAVIIVAFGVGTITNYNRMLNEYGRAYEDAYQGERLNHLISNAVMESRGIYLSKSKPEARDFADRLLRNLDDIDVLMGAWPNKTLIDLETLKPRIKSFVANRRKLARAGVDISPAAAEKMGTDQRAERMALQAEIEQVVTETRVRLEATQIKASEYNQQRIIAFALIALAGIGFSVLVSLWLIRHFITREIERAKTAEVAREALLKQLMQSNTELERFAYVASHDMQEPVRMVSIFSQMVAREYDDKLDAQGRQYLGIIRNSSQHMLTLVQDLLNYARLQPEASADVSVDMNEQLKHVRANLGELIANQDAQIDAPDLPKVMGNPVQIQRLLQNMVSNAIKYRDPERTPHIRVEVKETPEEWQIGVRDNGLGIEPQFQTQIFEPFRRLHTWEQVAGTGMGLAICRKIVEHHGGRIWVESEAGEGSCFWFTLKKPEAKPMPIDMGLRQMMVA